MRALPCIWRISESCLERWMIALDIIPNISRVNSKFDLCARFVLLVNLQSMAWKAYSSVLH